MQWSGKRVLVTGAGGFIGSHLTEHLAELGARVRALVRYHSRGTAGWLESSPCRDGIEIVRGDIRDAASVRRAVQGVDVVFHLAALIGIPYSYEAPDSYVRTNVDGTLHVLQAALDFATPRVIVTSTSEVYGTARTVPIAEDHPLQAQSPYSATKIAADKLAESFVCAFNAPVAIARPFNTYGPRQSARAVIPTLITQVLSGGEVRIGNLSPTRDFSFVSDTVAGFTALAEHSEVTGEFNFGAGKEISIAALAQTIAELTGREVNLVSSPDRIRPDTSEVERLCADNRKAREILGWLPRVPLRDGLARTIEWIRTNLAQYRVGQYQV
jgi:dTDP-glucose 4,6-dehydratase